MVLHRKNPAVREKPVFEGLLRCQKWMAERVGFFAECSKTLMAYDRFLSALFPSTIESRDARVPTNKRPDVSTPKAPECDQA
ncbi:hypothetical protein Q3C01_41140 [Bradyrhizobium sp. UFLA05-109]